MRRLLIVLLAAGAVAGFAIGFGRLCGYGPHGYGHFGPSGYGRDRRDFEDHVAEVCTRAAERVVSEHAKATPAAPTPAAAR